MSFVTNVTLTSPLLTMEFPVMHAKPTDQYIVKSIDGLGPPPIDVSLGDGLYQGGIYRGSLPQDREIVFMVRLNPRYKEGWLSAAGLRTRLYSMLAGQYSTLVTVYTDSNNEYETRYIPREMITKGYVRNIEINPFAKDAEVQITIICPVAWFEDVEDIVEPIPIENPFVYNATAPTGFLFDFVVKEALGQLVLSVEGNEITKETIVMNYPMEVDDIVIFDTHPGRRSVKLIRPVLSPDPRDITGFATIENSLWPALRPGSNKILVYNNASLEAVEIVPREFRYRKHYWGV